MNDYESKQARKKEYFAEKAKKLREEADKAYQQAHNLAQIIPFGQPVLVGHHSEGRDRRFRQKIHSTFSKSFELQKKAEYYENRTITESNAISSDDGDAINKLESKLKSLIDNHNRMKEINRLYKKEGDACLENLTENEKEEILSVRLVYSSGLPFRAYSLANSNQNIRQVKERIRVLRNAQSAPEREAVHGDGYILKEDKSDNRILFIFEGKPNEEVRKILKRHAFKWSPTRSAWIRMLNGNGREAAKIVISKLNDLDV